MNKSRVNTSSALLDDIVVTHIEPVRGWEGFNFSELWEHFDLLYIFVWRDIKVRYKQTVLGVFWAILQPLFMMVIFSVFFGKLVDVPSDGIPYPIFSYTALVPWTFFANGVLFASNSLVNNAHMLKKIYFPRLTMPIASIGACIIDFMLAFVVLLGMLFMYGQNPTLNVIWLPFFFMLACITALGVSFWLSALNVQFRDVRYIVPFVLQVWLFATPIVYPSSLLPEPWQTLYGINPMAGVVEGFRWSLLGTDTAPEPIIFVSTFVALVLFLSGVLYFRKKEKYFADVI